MPLSPFERWKKQLIDALEPIGLRTSMHQPSSPELYLGGFATVQCSIYPDHVFIERYYDNELIDEDRHFDRSIPFEGEIFADIPKILALCTKLVASIRNDEPILNFAE